MEDVVIIEIKNTPMRSLIFLEYAIPIIGNPREDPLIRLLVNVTFAKQELVIDQMSPFFDPRLTRTALLRSIRLARHDLDEDFKRHDVSPGSLQTFFRYGRQRTTTTALRAATPRARECSLPTSTCHLH